jgi:hypothetical protein
VAPGVEGDGVAAAGLPRGDHPVDVSVGHEPVVEHDRRAVGGRPPAYQAISIPSSAVKRCTARSPSENVF